MENTLNSKTKSAPTSSGEENSCGEGESGNTEVGPSRRKKKISWKNYPWVKEGGRILSEIFTKKVNP